MNKVSQRVCQPDEHKSVELCCCPPPSLNHDDFQSILEDSGIEFFIFQLSSLLWKKKNQIKLRKRGKKIYTLLFLKLLYIIPSSPSFYCSFFSIWLKSFFLFFFWLWMEFFSSYFYFYLFIYFYFPTVQQRDQVILTCIQYNYIFFRTLCSVATWVSRQSSQCYSAGSPCKSILSCVW